MICPGSQEGGCCRCSKRKISLLKIAVLKNKYGDFGTPETCGTEQQQGYVLCRSCLRETIRATSYLNC